jgi:hypothetical protein
MKTEDLIVSLARDVRSVRRLRHPWRRAAMWTAATTIYLAAVVLLMAPPGRLTARFELRFSFEQLAAGLLGLTAAAAVIPGYRRRIFIAPIAMIVLWTAIVAMGSRQDLLRYGSTGVPL